MLDSFGAGLTREPDQEGNTHGFFEHCFFPEKMMRAKAVAMIACVHNNRMITQTRSFQATKNGADALVHQCDEPEITLLNTAVFLRSNSKKQLSRQPLSIQDCFRLLPFAHQPVTERNIFSLRSRGCYIKIHISQRMLVVERAVVGRMRFYKTNNENERIVAMFLNELGCMSLEKLWPRQFDGQTADGQL